MIEQTGTVTAKGDGLLQVRVAPSPGCARCEAGHGCGQGLIGQISGQSAHCIPVTEPVGEDVQVGDVVVLGMESRGLLVASFLVYLLPLALMMGGALLAAGLWPGAEGMTALWGVGGLGAGFLWVRRLAGRARLGRHMQPRFLRTGPARPDQSLT